jgi:FkbM family methyltransferase
VSLAQWEAKHRGDRYLVDGHGVVGWGYALFHHQLEWLHRTERMLSFDHRSPHSHDECAPDCPYWHEDSWATKLFHENAYQVWHPIPSILDHDTSIPSAYAHENHKTRRAPVTWWAYDSEQLTSPSFWRPQLGLVPPMQTRKIPCRYGAFHVPAEPLHRTVGSELTCLHVFLGEYEYERPGSEPVETMVDVGCNVGASIVWAQQWWPSLKRIDGYDPNVDALEFAHINVQNCAHSADVKLHHLAVTVDQHPLFKEHDDWGGSRTHGETTGVRVNGIHPRDLPAADVLKCDAEGVDGDVFEHYQHWSGVEVAMFEYHTAADRERMVRVVTEAGLTMVKHRPDSDTQGVMIWVRR